MDVYSPTEAFLFAHSREHRNADCAPASKRVHSGLVGNGVTGIRQCDKCYDGEGQEHHRSLVQEGL